MADYSITTTVFDDANASQTQEVGEPGLSEISVTVSREGGGGSWTVVGSGMTDTFGVYDLTLTGQPDPATYRITCTIAAGWEFTTSNPVEVTLTTVVGAVQVFVGQRRGKTCFQAGSSWVHKVCWVPSSGVQVTFHDRRGRPTVTVRYPNTTYADYQAFVVALSLGRHIHAWYYRRPYVIVPLEI